MSRDELVLEQDSRGYYIVWWIADAEGADLGDYGAEVGDDYPRHAGASWEAFVKHYGSGIESTTDVRVWYEATRLGEEAVASDNASKITYGGFRWEHRKQAASVLKQAQQRAKLWAQGSENWPGWAQTALAEGWKPPKGWKP